MPSLIWFVITSSLSCTIFSDMVYSLLSNGVSQLHSTRGLQTMSLCMPFSICANYCTLSIRCGYCHDSRINPLLIRAFQDTAVIGRFNRDIDKREPLYLRPDFQAVNTHIPASESMKAPLSSKPTKLYQLLNSTFSASRAYCSHGSEKLQQYRFPPAFPKF